MPVNPPRKLLSISSETCQGARFPLRHRARPHPQLWIALALVTATAGVHGATHVWKGGFNSNFSIPLNWEGNKPPLAGEAGPIIVRFTSTGAKQVTLDAHTPPLDEIRFEAAGYTLSAASSRKLRLAPGASITGSSDFAIESPIELELGGGASVDMGSGADATLAASLTLAPVAAAAATPQPRGSVPAPAGISLPPRLTKTGLGSLKLTGDRPVASGLRFLVQQGRLDLDRTTVPVPSDLQVGDGTGQPNTARARLLRPDQIKPSASVTVLPDGWLDLGNFENSFEDLELRGGRAVTTALGRLILTGNLTTSAAATASRIEGRLSLGRDTRTFTIADGTASPDLLITAVVSGAQNFLPGIIKAGPGELTLDGEGTFGGPISIHDGRLVAGHPNALGPDQPQIAADKTVVKPGATLVIDTPTIPKEDISLEGTGHFGVGALLIPGGTTTLGGRIELAGPTSIRTGSGASATFTGNFAGSADLEKVGPGNLTFSGNVPNTHTGDIRVNEGRLTLNKGADTIAVRGTLTIGDGVGGSGADRVVITSNHQLAITVRVIITSSGLLDLIDHPQTIGTLELSGGSVLMGSAALNLTGDLLLNPNQGIPTLLAGHLHFPAGDHKIHIASHLTTPDLDLTAAVSDTLGATLTKTGPGTLALSGSNWFFGEFIADEGVLIARNNASFGASQKGTRIGPNASLVLGNGAHVGAEPLILPGQPAPAAAPILSTTSGDASWAGPVTLLPGECRLHMPANSSLTLSGPISGAGSLAKTGAGDLELGGTQPNTFSGGALVLDGRLRCTKAPAPIIGLPGPLTVGDGIGGPGTDIVEIVGAGQLGSTPVFLSPSGKCSLQTGTATLPSVTGPGILELANATLKIGAGGGSFAFDGTITGASSKIEKYGPGQWTVTGNSPYTGELIAREGSIHLTGQVAGTVGILSPGTLTGTGAGGKLRANSGTVSPGASPGMLTFNDGIEFASASASFNVEALGPNPGSDHDQLVTAGPISITDSKLNFSPGFTPPPGGRFVIIRNLSQSPIQGTFGGLPEGAKFIVNGVFYEITYTGTDSGLLNQIIVSRANLLPTSAILDAPTSIVEGDTVTLTAAFSDPDADDPHTVTVHWGDNPAPDTFTLPAGTNSFTRQHLYLDNPPTGSGGHFQISVEIQDLQGGKSVSKRDIEIENAWPLIALDTSELALDVGQTWTRTGSFSDPGADQWTATVDYGTGNPEPLILAPDKSFTLQHTYTNSGKFSVIIQIKDDEEASTDTSFDVLVSDPVSIVPVLAISLANPAAGSITVSWKDPSAAFILQSRSTLAAADSAWSNVESPVKTDAEDHHVVVEASALSTYFRLFKPASPP